MEENQSSSKRKLKNPVKFQIQLDDEQKEAKRVIRESKITILKGEPGSGKTSVAVNTALDMLFNNEIEKIILTRATITAEEELGFLPGNIDSKLEPYIAPLTECMEHIYKHDTTIKNLLEKGSIDIKPIGFLRGHNFYESTIVVVDEAQNIKHNQMKLILTRLCKGAKIIFCGDIEQCDLKHERESGFDFVCKEISKLPGVKLVELKNNHRDELVKMIIETYRNHNSN